LVISNDNKDGQADVIHLFNDALYVPSGFTSKYFVTSGGTRVMTPQMQEVASRLLKANRDLALLIDQGQHAVQQETQE